MPSQLEQRIAQFTDWRVKLVTAIDEFRSWQDTYGHADIEQTLRIYDLVEGLRNDRMRLAFLGESAEDKIGLINALLFSDLPGGLLPLGPGSELLCATEIFHDPGEAPFVRVLPMDTRKRPESIAALRRSPIEWITMRLNPDSPESIAEAMHSLIESRTVGIDEAKSLNLTNVERSGDAVSIPAWRYALINLPHPMLKSGLIALYSPGLQMLSTEPEIALRMTSSAQSLLMILGSELTLAVRDVWKQYVQTAQAHKFVVLDTGAGADAGGVEHVAKTLEIPASNVFPIAVKQAVSERLARTQTPEHSAGIEQLERLHAEKLVPERQVLLLAAVANEIGPLVQSARQAVAARFIATIKEMQDLTSTSGKHRNVAQDMLTRLETERKTYQKSVASFNITYTDLMARGQELLATLHDDRIEDILSHDKEFIEGAWTTAGLWKNMQGLFAYFTVQVEKILNYAVKLKEAVDGIYQNFHENFGLAKLSPPPLTLEKHLDAMHALEENARSFCHNPINIATYKDMMVKKFYDGLVEEARQQFELTRIDTEHWLRGALGPLNGQIMERQKLMLKRVENLRNLKDNLTSVQERLKQLDQQRVSLKKQGEQLDQLRADLALSGPTAARAAGEAKSATAA
ncbi:MAG: hypothetical protein HY525_19640 [Betaproteobacteria bacterium]|nr:hypothetical protein [Betaproteobacteria bacterium]